MVAGLAVPIFRVFTVYKITKLPVVFFNGFTTSYRSPDETKFQYSMAVMHSPHSLVRFGN